MQLESSRRNHGKNFGFTLSDVLLTLVTIAIVALLVISPLLKNIQDTLKKVIMDMALIRKFSNRKKLNG